MAIPRQEQFDRDEILPSWFVNRLQDRLAALSRLKIKRATATQVSVEAAAGTGAAVLNVGGLWRFNEATVTLSHPGGAAGTYYIWATALNQVIVSSPAPGTDNTNYAFGLFINAADGGGLPVTPAVVAGVREQFRLIGALVWDGAAITGLFDLLDPIDASQLGNVSSLATSDVLFGQRNGSLDLNLSGGIVQQLGLESRGGAVGPATKYKGRAMSWDGTTRNLGVSGGTLLPIPTVPAIVTDVEVPINGMLWVAFEVLVQSAPGGSVAAGLYIDGVQAATVAQAAPPGFTALQAMTAGSEARLLSADASFAFSIITDIPDWFTAAHRTRGVGWLGFFRQGGGTFDVEIRMGVISGTIEVREHLLLVKSESFDNPNV